MFSKIKNKIKQKIERHIYEDLGLICLNVALDTKLSKFEKMRLKYYISKQKYCDYIYRIEHGFCE